MAFFEEITAGLPTWWVALLSTSLLVAMSTAIFVPLYIAGTITKYGAKVKKRKNQLNPKDQSASEDEDDKPRLEQADYQDCASFVDCPWNFKGCNTVGDAIDRVWQEAQDTQELMDAKEVLKKRVDRLWVARITSSSSEQASFFAVYTLKTGAELFGGGPADSADLGAQCGPGEATDAGMTLGQPVGLRRRIADGMMLGQSKKNATASLHLPSLTPFQRVHDGFGVVLNSRHLVSLWTNPLDSVNGSCFYVYPQCGFEFTRGKSYLIKFGRIDKDCVACADKRISDEPRVIYVERSGEQCEDNETPLAFVVDTIRNIAGERTAGYPSYLMHSGAGVEAAEEQQLMGSNVCTTHQASGATVAVQAEPNVTDEIQSEGTENISM